MYKKVSIFAYVVSIIFIIFWVEIIYIFNTKSLKHEQVKQKKMFVKMTSLPDTAIFTQNKAIRNRSLANVFDIYSVDGNLIEYDTSAFTISHSHIENL